jgi:DNA-binding MarR family transcriptional regulator
MPNISFGQAEPSYGGAEDRGPQRLKSAVKESARQLSVQLSLLNAQVSAHLKLKEVDLLCLDVITRYKPISPSALARRAGLHPATLTGILDRLERGGFITRERDPADRRAVLIWARRERNAEIYRRYGGMNAAMDGILGRYADPELELLADFLRRTVEAGHTATVALAAD